MIQFTFINLLIVSLLGGITRCQAVDPGTEYIQGSTGSTGRTGEMGPSGDTGATGPDGYMGSTGATGRSGVIGPIGSPGPKGPHGPKGSDGATGPMGESGSTGYTGHAGPTGARGVRGERGDPGVPGNRGELGPAGPTGYQGPEGSKGPSGATGPGGHPGPSGPSGPYGPAGPRGTPGQIGQSGGTGSMGITGATGLQGRDGTPGGATGFTGPMGPPGAPGSSPIVDDRCSSPTVHCQQKCVDTMTGHKCDCFPGYKLDFDNISCHDVNKCDKDNGDCQHTCTNTNNSRLCSCNTGFTLERDNKSCVQPTDDTLPLWLYIVLITFGILLVLLFVSNCVLIGIVKRARKKMKKAPVTYASIPDTQSSARSFTFGGLQPKPSTSPGLQNGNHLIRPYAMTSTRDHDSLPVIPLEHQNLARQSSYGGYMEPITITQYQNGPQQRQSAVENGPIYLELTPEYEGLKGGRPNIVPGKYETVTNLPTEVQNVQKGSPSDDVLKEKEQAQMSNGDIKKGHEGVNMANGEVTKGHEGVNMANGEVTKGHEGVNKANGNVINGQQEVKAQNEYTKVGNGQHLVHQEPRYADVK